MIQLLQRDRSDAILARAHVPLQLHHAITTPERGHVRRTLVVIETRGADHAPQVLVLRVDLHLQGLVALSSPTIFPIGRQVKSTVITLPLCEMRLHIMDQTVQMPWW